MYPQKKLEIKISRNLVIMVTKSMSMRANTILLWNEVYSNSDAPLKDVRDENLLFDYDLIWYKLGIWHMFLNIIRVLLENTTS